MLQVAYVALPARWWLWPCLWFQLPCMNFTTIFKTICILFIFSHFLQEKILSKKKKLRPLLGNSTRPQHTLQMFPDHCGSKTNHTIRNQLKTIYLCHLKVSLPSCSPLLPRNPSQGRKFNILPQQQYSSSIHSGKSVLILFAHIKTQRSYYPLLKECPHVICPR